MKDSYKQPLKKRLIVFCARNLSAIFAQVRTLFCQCAIYAQDLRKIFSPVRNICARCTYSPMRIMCARFAQDCTYFPNAQYMARFAQDCTYFPDVQDLRKITFHSSMCKMCARLYFFPLFDLFSPTCHFHVSVNSKPDHPPGLFF